MPQTKITNIPCFLQTFSQFQSFGIIYRQGVQQSNSYVVGSGVLVERGLSAVVGFVVDNGVLFERAESESGRSWPRSLWASWREQRFLTKNGNSTEN